MKQSIKEKKKKENTDVFYNENLYTINYYSCFKTLVFQKKKARNHSLSTSNHS